MLADIPGLIEGAHEGAGIGDRFLGHVERCAVLLHLVDATLDDPAEAYRIIRGELEAYGAGLEDKPEIVALSKCDAVPADELKRKAKSLAKAAGRKPLVLSAVSGDGHEGGVARACRDCQRRRGPSATRRRAARSRVAAMRAEWTGAKRLVVKIGSSLLVDSATGTLKATWLDSLATTSPARKRKARR